MNRKWGAYYLATLPPLGVSMFNVLAVKGVLSRLSPRSRPAGARPRVLILAYLTEENASARHRAYKYVPYLEQAGIDCDVVAPADRETYKALFAKGNDKTRHRYFVRVMINRFMAMLRANEYDAVILQRSILGELFYDPPLLVFALKLINPNLVYDFDDAIFMLPPQSVRSKSKVLNQLARLRHEANCAMSRVVIASTPELEASVHDKRRVRVVPTPVDVERYPVRVHTARSPVVIGWTGGPGNLKFLELVAEPLRELARRHPLVLEIVSSRPYEMPEVPTRNVEWSLAVESSNMADFDIGIMPLEDNVYTRGKAGFKLLQYMACGLPVVASPVGINSAIVQPGVTGYLARTPAEWVEHLERLITDPALRASMGAKGRKIVEAEYSYDVWGPRLADIVREAIQPS
ncbi:MAG: glycosyltransferase family 4 protein [Deltaproteobacteria bacterium]|nr:glycosyltransferase family 4 protein [Deltaproteobacteria bacterium]